MDFYLATHNLDKKQELQKLLEDLAVNVQAAELLGGMPEVEETGATLEDNACLKAEALRARLPLGAWVLADDSG